MGHEMFRTFSWLSARGGAMGGLGGYSPRRKVENDFFGGFFQF